MSDPRQDMKGQTSNKAHSPAPQPVAASTATPTIKVKVLPGRRYADAGKTYHGGDVFSMPAAEYPPLRHTLIALDDEAAQVAEAAREAEIKANTRSMADDLGDMYRAQFAAQTQARALLMKQEADGMIANAATLTGTASK